MNNTKLEDLVNTLERAVMAEDLLNTLLCYYNYYGQFEKVPDYEVEALKKRVRNYIEFDDSE